MKREVNGKTLAVLAVVVLAVSGAASGALSTFEDFTTGVSVNGQSGWTVEDQWGYDFVEGGKPNNLDEQVVDDGTGNKVWRVSNAYAYTEYAAQPFSPTAPAVAGESGSSLWNDCGPDHTNPYNPPHFGANATTNRFYMSMRFRSATGAAQPGLGITLSPSAKQSTVRMSYLRIADNGSTGFDILFYDTSNGDQNWNPTTVASGLSYSDSHSIAMDITFVDGVDNSGGQIDGNDVVRVYVDGSLVHTGTTWESYYYVAERIVPSEPRRQAVDSVLFRVSPPAALATLGNGLYFDDVEASNTPPPEVTTWKVATVHGHDQFTIGDGGSSLLYHQQPRNTKGWYWYNNNGSPPGTLATGGFQTPNGWRDGSRTFACTDVAVGQALNTVKLAFEYKTALGYTTVNYFLTDGSGKFGIFAPTSLGIAGVSTSEVIDSEWTRITLDLTAAIPDSTNVAVYEHNGLSTEHVEPFTTMQWGDIKNLQIAGMYDYQRSPAHGWDHWGTMFDEINQAGVSTVTNGYGLALIWGDTVGNTTYATQQRQIRNVRVSFAGVDYVATFADAQISDVLELNVGPDSIYVKPGENVVIDMNVSNLAQKVNACQAMLGYSSTYFADPTSGGCVAPGGGDWDWVIWDSWKDSTGIPGEIDTAIGVDAQGAVGTDADGRVAIITLVAAAPGVTQIVFRPDVSDVEGTFLSDMNAQPVWPTKIDSQTIVIDGTNPVVAVLLPNGGEYLKGGQSYDITWTASDTYLAPNSILIEYYDGSAWQTLATGEANDGSYTWYPVPSLDINTAKVRVSASDLAGNVGSDESDAAFTIDSTPPSLNIASAKQALTEGPFNAVGFTYKKVIDGGTGQARSASFSPDGSKIVYISRASGTDTMTLYDRATATSIALGSGPAGAAFTVPYFSADGSKIGWTAVNATTANDLAVYDVGTGTTTIYLHPATGTDDAANSDFLGSYTDRWVAWQYGVGGSVADLFLYTQVGGTNWQLGANLTGSATFKEYEPDSNRAGTKILYWSGETTAEPMDTAHILVWNGSAWVKDTGFTPVVGCTWAFWSYDETEIGLTKFDASPGYGKGDLYVYDSAGNFKFDLTGAAVGQGPNWQWFGFNFATGPSGTGREYLFTSDAGNSLGGRDTWIARKTPELLYSLTSVPREAATQGNVYIQVTASDALSGLAAAPIVTVTDSASTPMAVTSLGEGPTGTFTYSVTVTSSTANGMATVTATVSDRSGNSASDTDYFDIYKDQVTGTVSFATLSSIAYPFSRDVTFVATNSGGTVLKTWTVTVAFTNSAGTASGSYALTNVPAGTANLSAKTAWHLRKKQAVSFDGSGQAISAFTLLGGDFNESNSINVLDYSIMKTSWGSGTAGDVNGDGFTGTLDYSLMKANWFQTGDPQ